MSRVAQAVLASWSVSPGLVLLLAVVATVYVRGARRLPSHVPGWRIAAFLGGLATLLVAVASPLDAFAALLLQAHMVQHLLLTMVAPPLLLLGAPAMALLRGLPPRIARDALGPFLAWPALVHVGAWLVHPVVAWVLFVGVGWAWHIPVAYELALRSPGWHAAEHACFLGAALLFWWPVVQPWPSRPWWPRWAMVPYLLLADVQNTVLAGFLVFAERVVYPHYAAVPRLGGTTALADQAAAGAIMWVPGSIAFLIPAALILWRQLAPTVVATPVRVPATRRGPFDLLAVRGVGPLLRAAWTRRAAQGATLLLAAAIVADGLFGPAMSPMNLAGVLPWTYWRGAAVAVLLVAGNWLCFACPLTLPRALARRLGGGRRPWPRALRSKWLAVALLVAFFTAYEVWMPWDSPRATAWLMVAYFAVALAVEARWEGGSFCRWVCPVGQFQFVQSLVSPFEVRARAPSACATCTTRDCLRACDVDLLLPRKAGNLDCTFCLDCARACPHDNVGILATAPGAALVRPGGRLLRADTIGLVLVLVAAAFATAAAMTAPAVGPVLALLGVVPFVARRLAPERQRLALALVPLGVAMWIAHFGFHLLAGLGSGVPVAVRAFGIGTPDWSASAAMAVDAGTLLRFELVLLDAGLLFTLGLAWRIARRLRPAGALGLAAPWATVAVLLWLGGVWTFLQPMAMRGDHDDGAPVTARAIVVLLVVSCVAATAQADGGVIRGRGTGGGLAVTVFTAPQPPAVGPLDVSVLVQDAAGGPVLDAAVAVRLAGDGTTIAREATRDAATNKLLYAAVADVTAPGAWRLDVHVRRGDDEVAVATTVPVGPALPPLRALWPYVAVPPLGVALLALHQMLAGRRRGVDRTGAVAEDDVGAGSEHVDG